MKKILIAMFMVNSFSISASCLDISGKYELETMAKYCQVKTGGPLEIPIDYMIGDEAPLYTVLPEHQGSVGYIKPGLELRAKTSTDCKTFTLTFPETSLYQFRYKDLVFNNYSFSGDLLSSSSEEVLEERDKVRFIERKELNLRRKGRDLLINIRVDYLKQSRSKLKAKVLRFEEYDCSFKDKTRL